MSGVVILQTFKVVTESIPSFNHGVGFAVGCVGLIIGMAICLGISIHEEIDMSKLFVALFSLLIAIVLGFMGGWIGAHRTAVAEETRYLVHLTEELNYKEFINTYEILDYQDGTYTIREKD